LRTIIATGGGNLDLRFSLHGSEMHGGEEPQSPP
jgi:hypothetical protein